jgi:hypothetical protein
MGPLPLNPAVPEVPAGPDRPLGALHPNGGSSSVCDELRSTPAGRRVPPSTFAPPAGPSPSRPEERPRLARAIHGISSDSTP